MEALTEEDKSNSRGEASLVCILCCVSFEPGAPIKIGHASGGGDGDGQLVNGGDNENSWVGGALVDYGDEVTFSKFCDEVTANCTAVEQLQQLAIVKRLTGPGCQFNRKLIDGEVKGGMSVCLRCLKAIGGTMARKEKVDRLECHVRSLQVEILRELRELEGILEDYNYEMGRIKEVVRGSNLENCLQFQKRKEDGLESGIVLLRECILEGSLNRSPNFTDNISFQPKMDVEEAVAVEVKIEVEGEDDNGPMDFGYFPDNLNDDDNGDNEDMKNIIVRQQQPRKSIRTRKPVDMFIPENFLTPTPTAPVVPVISQSMLDCASDFLKKKKKTGSKTGKVLLKKKRGKKKKNLDTPPPRNPLIAPPPRPGKCIRKHIRLKSGRVVPASICCEICGFTTRKEPAFEQHLRDHETQDKPFQCTFCLDKFTTTTYLNFHVMGHQGHYKMCCDVCLKWVPFPELLGHIKSHVPPGCEDEGPQIIFCQNCTFCCTTQLAYTTHLGKHLALSGGGKFKCHKVNCGEEFGRLSDLKRHLDEDHEGNLKRWTCDWENCGKSYLSNGSLISHRLTAHPAGGKKEVECKECGKKFNGQHSLNVHILQKHTKESDKPFGCKVCADVVRFATKVELERHEIREHGKQKYKCGVCEQEFTDKQYLKNHVRALHGGKGEKCGECGKICLNGQMLKEHMISHSEERTWTCEECGKGFKRRRGLQLHWKVHSGDKGWKCGYCEKAFTRKEYLQMHERTHTGEKPYVCDVCGKAFSQRTTLTIHKKNQHNSKREVEGGGISSGQDVEAVQMQMVVEMATGSEMALPLDSGFT